MSVCTRQIDLIKCTTSKEGTKGVSKRNKALRGQTRCNTYHVCLRNAALNIALGVGLAQLGGTTCTAKVCLEANNLVI